MLLLALREVLDKEPPPQVLWAQGAVAAVLLFALARLAWRGGALAFLIALPLVWIALDPLLDPTVGPALRAEGGVWYVGASLGAAFLPLLAAVAGWWVRPDRARRGPRRSPRHGAPT